NPVCKAASLRQSCLQCWIKRDICAFDKVDGIGDLFVESLNRKFVPVVADIPEDAQGELIADLRLKVWSAGDPVVLRRSGGSIGDQVQVLIAPVIARFQR